MLKICNKCGFQQDEFLNIRGENYCKSCNSEIKIDSSQLSLQEQATLHQMKLLLGNFHFMLEPLEEYIEKAGYYPNFRNKRQLYRKTFRDSKGPLENDEDLFLSQVFIFASAVRRQPDFFREVIQEEFYKWINYTGITANNCPEVLKHFLIEINNVINGNDEKIIKETRKDLKDYKVNPKDLIGLFSGLQQPLNRSREQRVALEGKIWNELPNEDKFNGNPEMGKQAFEEIERSVSISHENFRLRYFGEKRPSELASYSLQASSSQQGGDMDLTLEKQPISGGNQPQKNSVGTSGIVAVITIVSALLVASVVVMKKRLSRKVKR
jgi:hypothetical protein